MRIVSHEHLLPGWIVSDLHPNGLTGSFFVKGHFCLELDAPISAAEESEPPSGDVFEDDDPARGLRYPSDFAPLKPEADVLLVGTANAPAGRPVPSLGVSLRVGSLTKRVRVQGDRGQTRLFDGSRAPVAVDPFTSLPLSWTRAHGGDRWNPVGCGHIGTPTPNQEKPDRGSGPRGASPAHFGPIAADWKPRIRGLGRYRGRWQHERWPWLPASFDYTHFNAAPLDQRIPGYLRGDEEIELRNLHPEQPHCRSQLPGLRVRCFLGESPVRDGDEPGFREVPLVLDTLWIDSDTGQVLLVWRGHLPVRSLELDEVETLYVATEPMADTAAPLEAHREKLAERLEAEDADDEEPDAAAERARRWRNIEGDFALTEKQFAVDAAADEADFEAAMKQLDKATPAEDLDGSQTLNPEAELERTLAWIASPEAGLDPEMAEQLASMVRNDDEEEDVDEEPDWTRERVEAALEAHESLAGARLVDVDLSDLDFSGADLRAARLDGADLSGCRFTAARMDRARLSKAQADGVDFSGAHLHEADLSQARLAGARFVEAGLEDADLSESDLDGADFSYCKASGADFFRAGLEEATFLSAELKQADLTDGRLARTNFSRATLEAACIEEAGAEEAIFDSADLTGLHASDGTNLRGASLREAVGPGSIWQDAVLDGADLRGAILRGADFSGASLFEAQLSRADLTETSFENARLEGAQLDETNLLRASFERSNLRDARFDGANAYAATTWDTLAEGASFKGTNRRRTELGR